MELSKHVRRVIRVLIKTSLGEAVAELYVSMQDVMCDFRLYVVER
jgi:hypothetical protein